MVVSERAAVRAGRAGPREHRAADEAVPTRHLQQPADDRGGWFGDGRRAHRCGRSEPVRHEAPDVATYRAALDTYGHQVPLSQFAGNAFTAVMNLKAVLDKLGPTGVTPDAITNAIRAGSDGAVVHDRHLHVRWQGAGLTEHVRPRSPRLAGDG